MVADTQSKYEAYAPLYHLLPNRILDRHGLPTLKAGKWPLNILWAEEMLPRQFPDRLSNAFADHVWKFLDSGSGLRAFSRTEPLTLLSHNLDYWLPHAVRFIEKRMSEFGRIEPETKEERRRLAKLKAAMPPGIDAELPLRGGAAWIGEDEATQATLEVVEEADRHGQLRGLMDAVRSNRVVEDFSDRWSFAREDFERKLYRKRRSYGSRLWNWMTRFQFTAPTVSIQTS